MERRAVSRFAKDCLLLISFTDFILTVSTYQVEDAEAVGACNGVQCHVNSGKGVGILSCDCIQLPVIDTKLYRTIHLAEKDNEQNYQEILDDE